MNDYQLFKDAAAEMDRLRESRAPRYGEVGKVRTPTYGDVGKVPSAAALLKAKQPDDWLIDQFGARGSMVVLGGATGASKSTLLYGMAQAISTGDVFGGQLQCKRGKVLVI